MAGVGAGLGKRRERGGEEEGGEVEGREREGPQVTVEPGPFRALLCHCEIKQTLTTTTAHCEANWMPRNSKNLRNGIQRN